MALISGDFVHLHYAALPTETIDGRREGKGWSEAKEGKEEDRKRKIQKGRNSLLGSCGWRGEARGKERYGPWGQGGVLQVFRGGKVLLHLTRQGVGKKIKPGGGVAQPQGGNMKVVARPGKTMSGGLLPSWSRGNLEKKKNGC